MKFPPDRIVLGAVGFLATATLGWILAGGSPETVSGKSTDVPPTRSSRLRPSRAASPRDLADARLAAIRNAADPAERLRATIALANALSVSEFGKWLAGGWFSVRDGAEFTLFANILHERWWREDPEGFLLWSIKNDSRGASSTLASWAASEPQQFIDFFKLHPDDSTQLDALADLADTDPDVALQCLLEMKGDRRFSYALFEKLIEKSPAALEAALDSFEKSLKTRVERMLILKKFENDYDGELRKLWARPDGLEIYQDIAPQVKGMQGAIFDDLADLPPKWREAIAGNAWKYIDAVNAEKWWNADLAAAGFSQPEVDRLKIQALGEIAVKNPEFALQRLAGFEIPSTESEGGTPDDRWAVIEKALTARPEKAAELIALLTTDAERRAVASILKRSSEKNDREAAKTIETPEQWLAKVTTIHPEARYEYGSMLRKWDPEKLAVIGEQFQTLPDDQKQQVARVIASSVSAGDSQPSLVGDAIHYLLTQPAEATHDNSESLAAKTSSYIAKLAINEPETARDWIQTLPDGEPKLWAQVNLRTLWSGYDPKAANQWFDSLPAATRAEVLKVTKKN